MGEYADDIKEQDFVEEAPIILIPLEFEYEVSIVHRKTGNCEWRGSVVATSSINARNEFRKKYAHIRNQYTHDYGLLVRRLTP